MLNLSFNSYRKEIYFLLLMRPIKVLLLLIWKETLGQFVTLYSEVLSSLLRNLSQKIWPFMVSRLQNFQDTSPKRTTQNELWL